MPTIRQIVLDMRDALAKQIGDAKRVYVVAGRRNAKDIPNLVGDRDLIIRVGGFMCDPGHEAAAGRSNTILRRRLDVILRSRTATDPTGSDLQWLTKEGLGHLEYEDAIMDVIQMWLGNVADVGNEATEPLLMVGDGEPARILSGSDADRDFQSADGKWGTSALTVEIVYRQSFTVRDYE